MNNFIKAINLLRRYATNLRTCTCPFTGKTQIVGGMVSASDYQLNRIIRALRECDMEFKLVGAKSKGTFPIINIIIQNK